MCFPCLLALLVWIKPTSPRQSYWVQPNRLLLTPGRARGESVLCPHLSHACSVPLSQACHPVLISPQHTNDVLIGSSVELAVQCEGVGVQPPTDQHSGGSVEPCPGAGREGPASAAFLPAGLWEGSIAYGFYLICIPFLQEHMSFRRRRLLRVTAPIR